MAESKRHHVQPQAYLRGFSIPGRDGWLYLHELGTDGATEQQTHNIALENRYNALRGPDGSIMDNRLEGLLAELEGASYAAVKHIADGAALEGDDRRPLALFVAMMINRSQRLRKRMEAYAVAQTTSTFEMINADPEWRARTLEYLRVTQETTPETFERDAKRLIAGVHIDTPELRNIGLLAHGRTNNLATVLESMRWSFIFADPGFDFLTSDDPVRYVAPSRNNNTPVGLGHKDVELTFPLTHKVAMVADRVPGIDGHWRAKKDAVQEINRRTLDGALRFVYSPYTSSPLQRQIRTRLPLQDADFVMETVPLGRGSMTMMRVLEPPGARRRREQ